MIKFDRIDAHRILLSSFGSLALTAATIGGVASPAHAAPSPTTIEAWQKAVERKIGTMNDRYSLAMPGGHVEEAVLAVSFTAAGDYTGATIVRSSGDRALDAHAVQVAGRIAYPQLPAGYLGQPRTVAMRLFFGRADTARQMADMQDAMARPVRVASADRAGGRVAAK